MGNVTSEDPLIEFRSLQYSLFLTIFVEVIGSLFFFLTALHIQKDKAMVDLTIAGKWDDDRNGPIRSDRSSSQTSPSLVYDIYYNNRLTRAGSVGI